MHAPQGFHLVGGKGHGGPGRRRMRHQDAADLPEQGVESLAAQGTERYARRTGRTPARAVSLLLWIGKAPGKASSKA